MWANCDVIVFPHACSIKLIFSITITFYLTKTENIPKNLLHNPHTIDLSRSTIFFQKKLKKKKKILIVRKKNLC